MNKYLKFGVVALVLTALILPGVSQASVFDRFFSNFKSESRVEVKSEDAVKYRENNSNDPDKFCHSWNTTLSFGATGNDVVALNRALDIQGFATGDANGRYTEVTASAVVGFQEKYRSEILDPAGLKYGTGILGSNTRAKLNVLYKCDSPVGSGAPVIEKIDAPTVLRVGETGTWTVVANDPENGSLSYSVVWGDEANVSDLRNSSISGRVSFSQEASFSHVYYKEGVYRPVFMVTDAQGLSAKTSVSVRVGTTTPPPATTTLDIKILSPNGGEVWKLGLTETISWMTLVDESVGPSPVDIFLIPENCESWSCYVRSYFYQPNFMIAKGIVSNSYSWEVGKVMSERNIVEGNYKIKVCQTNSGICDGSDTSFKIVK